MKKSLVHIFAPQLFLAVLFFSSAQAQIQLDTDLAQTPAQCDVVYAVHDQDIENSQIFAYHLDNGQFEVLGALHIDFDLEGLDLHPNTRVLYASAGQPNAQLYTVDAASGALTSVGAIGFDNVTSLAFHPNGQLWAGSDQGLLQVDVTTGKGALVEALLPSVGTVESLAWQLDGTRLFATTSDATTSQLWVYDETQQWQVACEGLPAKVESLETLPDGRLIYAFHQDASLGIHVFDVATCTTQTDALLATPYNDIEGLAWPVETCTTLSNMDALRAYLTNLDGVTSIEFQETGDIAVLLNGELHQGALATEVIAGTPPADGALLLVAVDDQNADGIADFLVTYPSGDQQVLYYYGVLNLPLTDKQITQHTNNLLFDPDLFGSYPIIYSFNKKVPANQVQSELERLNLSPVWVQALQSDITLATSIGSESNIEQAIFNYLQQTSVNLPDEVKQEILSDLSMPLVQAVVAFGDVEAHRQFAQSSIVYGSVFVLPDYDPRFLVMHSLEDASSNTSIRKSHKKIDSTLCPEFEAKYYDEKPGIWPWHWPIEGEVEVKGPKWHNTKDAFIFSRFKFPKDMEVMPCDPEGIKAREDAKYQFGMEFNVEFDDFNNDEYGFGSLNLDMFKNNPYISTDIDELDKIKNQPLVKLHGWTTNLPTPYLDPECILGDETEDTNGSYNNDCSWWNPLDEADKVFKVSVGVLDASKLKNNEDYWFRVKLNKPPKELNTLQWPLRAIFNIDVTHVDLHSSVDTWGYTPDDPDGNPRWIPADGSKYGSLEFLSFHKHSPERNWNMQVRTGVPTISGINTKFYAPSWDDVSSVANDEKKNLNFLRTFGDKVFSCDDNFYAIACASDKRVPVNDMKPTAYEINRFNTISHNKLNAINEPIKTEHTCHIKGPEYIKGNMWITQFEKPKDIKSLIGIGFNTANNLSFGYDVVTITDGTKHKLECDDSGCIQLDSTFSKKLPVCELFSDVNVEVIGPGEGVVTSPLEEFSCQQNSAPENCQHLFIRAFQNEPSPTETSFLNGDSIILTATAEKGSSFAGWEGDCESFGQDPICQLPKQTIVNVTARFAASAHRFIDHKNGSITDTQTNLVWLKDANCFGREFYRDSKNSAYTLKQGKKCPNFGFGQLNDNSNRGDWRLPTQAELVKLTTPPNGISWGQWRTELTSVFNRVQYDKYWTATEGAVVDLGTGNAESYVGKGRLWAVRNAVLRFSKDSSGVITDHQTGLSWYDAQPIIATDGWTATPPGLGALWRMPTIIELQELMTAPQELRDQYFTKNNGAIYWSSTEVPYIDDRAGKYAWAIQSISGNRIELPKDTKDIGIWAVSD